MIRNPEADVGLQEGLWSSGCTFELQKGGQNPGSIND